MLESYGSNAIKSTAPRAIFGKIAKTKIGSFRCTFFPTFSHLLCTICSAVIVCEEIEWKATFFPCCRQFLIDDS